MSLRPSSVSATSRTITPSRTVQLETQQQPEQESLLGRWSWKKWSQEKELPLALQIQSKNNLQHLCEKSLKKRRRRKSPTRGQGRNHQSRDWNLSALPPLLDLLLYVQGYQATPRFGSTRPERGRWSHQQKGRLWLGWWVLKVHGLWTPHQHQGVNPSSRQGSGHRGRTPSFFHLAEEKSDEHRSTSSPSVLPKRTLSQAYSHSPPPTSRDIPHSRFHQPKREQSPPERDLPLQGTVEAPAFEDRVRRPEPPPPKKSRIEFGTRPVLASGPSSSSRQLPISPPSKRPGQEGAASSEAHRPPSFGACPRSGIKQVRPSE